MEDMGTPPEYKRNWHISLPLHDAIDHIAFSGTDVRALVAIITALTRPGVTNPLWIKIILSEQ